MSEISYTDACVPVRDDLRAAHDRQWQRLAQPGTWWTGAGRVAIATEVLPSVMASRSFMGPFLGCRPGRDAPGKAGG